MSLPSREIAPAKLNLALHVRGRLPDGRHAIETVFAFCTDGDLLSGVALADGRLELETSGHFAPDLGDQNLITMAAIALLTRRRWLEGATLVVAGVGIITGAMAFLHR